MWIDVPLNVAQRIDGYLLLFGYAVALVGVFSLFCVFGLGELLHEGARGLKNNPLFALFFLLGCFAFSHIAFTCPGNPPVVSKQGIKIEYLKNDSDGVFIRWSTADEDIKVGEDEFIIKYRERQIPARTGWSAKEYELGRTKELYYDVPGFYRNRDIRISVEVNKELTK